MPSRQPCWRFARSACAAARMRCAGAASDRATHPRVSGQRQWCCYCCPRHRRSHSSHPDEATASRRTRPPPAPSARRRGSCAATCGSPTTATAWGARASGAPCARPPATLVFSSVSALTHTSFFTFFFCVSVMLTFAAIHPECSTFPGDMPTGVPKSEVRPWGPEEDHVILEMVSNEGPRCEPSPLLRPSAPAPPACGPATLTKKE